MKCPNCGGRLWTTRDGRMLVKHCKKCGYINKRRI